MRVTVSSISAMLADTSWELIVSLNNFRQHVNMRTREFAWYDTMQRQWCRKKMIRIAGRGACVEQLTTSPTSFSRYELMMQNKQDMLLNNKIASL